MGRILQPACRENMGWELSPKNRTCHFIDVLSAYHLQKGYKAAVYNSKGQGYSNYDGKF
jgi:hypothetical protein